MVEIDKIIKEIEITKDEMEEAIRRRIRHITFAKALLFFYYMCKKDDYVFPRELAKKLKTITTPRAWQILNEFEKLGLAKREVVGGETVFTLGKNNPMDKWVEEAYKTIKKLKG